MHMFGGVLSKYAFFLIFSVWILSELFATSGWSSDISDEGYDDEDDDDDDDEGDCRFDERSVCTYKSAMFTAQ